MCELVVSPTKDGQELISDAKDAVPEHTKSLKNVLTSLTIQHILLSNGIKYEKWLGSAYYIMLE